MMLCGVCVAEGISFEAHSDGDVAVHALCDALLGALALGDIGHYFPPSDERWKDADSLELLSRVMALVRERGYRLGNADITIALQAPKLGALVGAMRGRLAEVLGCEADAVSVKATTTEHLGFVGRGEGCEAWATVLLVAA